MATWQNRREAKINKERFLVTGVKIKIRPA
jgi:hypothetical protein